MPSQTSSRPSQSRCGEFGVLTPWLGRSAGLLRRQGYAEASITGKLQVVRNFCRWIIEEKNGAVTDFDEATVAAFFEARPRAGHVRRGDLAALHQFLGQLRRSGVVPPAMTVRNGEVGFVAEFAKHLVAERGLARPTVTTYVSVVRRFLCERFGSGAIAPDELHPSDVAEFVLLYARSVSPHWYLSAVPELLQLAATRLDVIPGGLFA